MKSCDYQCRFCTKSSGIYSLHHLFSQTKINKRLYPDFIHNEKNIIEIDLGCHLNKPIPHISEIEFCILMGIEPRSTSGKIIWKRMQQNADNT